MLGDVVEAAAAVLVLILELAANRGDRRAQAHGGEPRQPGAKGEAITRSVSGTVTSDWPASKRLAEGEPYR